jgi:myo-inositol 2-dehydrogenase/D-chiro-inositol 1-dehydrogenase
MGTAMRIGLLGAGRIGRIHGGNIAAHPRAQLAAIADADAAAAHRLATASGATIASVDAIIADREIDAVVICTSTDTHADLIERAVRAGKAVFCEKPVDLDAGRIRACLDVVRAANGKLMVGFNRRFDPSFAAIHRRIEAGEVGTVELVTILSRDPAPPPPGYIVRSGGLFRDRAIAAAGDVDTAAVLLKTASGKIAQISNSRRATYGYDQRIEVHGSLGLLAAGNRQATTVEHAGEAGYLRDPALPFFLERYAEAYRLELDSFVAAVQDGAPLAPTGEDGLRAQVLADAATQAAKTGHPVRLDA